MKNIIFDADGTLLDSMKIWMEVSPKYLEARGKVCSKELQAKLFSMSLEEGCTLVKTEFNLEESVEQIKSDILAMVTDFYKNEVQLKPGAYEFIQKMCAQNIKMCVATAGNSELMKSAFKRLKVYDFFEALISCNDLQIQKTESRFFCTVAKRLNWTVNETVVFEDALVPITSAKNAGFVVVGVSDIFSKKQEEQIRLCADYFIEDFYETMRDNWSC